MCLKYERREQRSYLRNLTTILSFTERKNQRGGQGKLLQLRPPISDGYEQPRDFYRTCRRHGKSDLDSPEKHHKQQERTVTQRLPHPKFSTVKNPHSCQPAEGRVNRLQQKPGHSSYAGVPHRGKIRRIELRQSTGENNPAPFE